MRLSGISDLFRKEVLDHKQDTWLGDILIIRPLSFAMLTWLFFGIATVIIAYLVWGEYTKKARVTGYVVPNQGLIKIFAQQPGTVTSLAVKEGDSVKKGAVLATVSTERSSVQGNTQVELAKQLELRHQSLSEQIGKTRQLYAQQAESIRHRLIQIQQEQARLASTIELQLQRVKIAETVVEKNERLYFEHFVSELAVQEKKADLLDQQTRLKDEERSKLASEGESVNLTTELQNIPIKQANDIAVLERSIGEITGESIENEARRETYIMAPQDGIITALQIDPGKQANISQPLMNLIPANARLDADLYVPSRSAGFIRVGNFAELQYQAFPYQKFGSHEGEVIKISRTAVAAQELPFPAAPQDVYYVVTVRPKDAYVEVYGKKEALQSGMQVDADIWIDHRTLIEWILEPLYSISGRA